MLGEGENCQYNCLKAILTLLPWPQHLGMHSYGKQHYLPLQKGMTEQHTWCLHLPATRASIFPVSTTWFRLHEPLGLEGGRLPPLHVVHSPAADFPNRETGNSMF